MTPSEVIELDRFGRMTLCPILWKSEIGVYRGVGQWLGESITVSLGPENPTLDLANVLNTVERLWSNQSDWKQRIEEYAVEQLLTNKNDNWRDRKEPPATREQFIDALQLYHIVVNEDGYFGFYHIVGNFFKGHEVFVDGILDRKFMSAQLPDNRNNSPRPPYLGNLSSRKK